MEETATQPTEETPVVVEKPEAVLAKNKELLGKLAKEKEQRESLAARIAEFEAEKAERERKNLERKGEWEQLRANLEESKAKEIAEREARYSKLFENTSRYQLAVELDGHGVLEGKTERLAKLLLLEAIRPVEEDNRVVWRRLDTDEEVNLKDFIPSIKDAYGEYFMADNNPGSNAPGSGKGIGGSKNRSKMTTAEKTAYIRQHGQAAYHALPY